MPEIPEINEADFHEAVEQLHEISADDCDLLSSDIKSEFDEIKEMMHTLSNEGRKEWDRNIRHKTDLLGYSGLIDDPRYEEEHGMPEHRALRDLVEHKSDLSQLGEVMEVSGLSLEELLSMCGLHDFYDKLEEFGIVDDIVSSARWRGGTPDEEGIIDEKMFLFNLGDKLSQFNDFGKKLKACKTIQEVTAFRDLFLGEEGIVTELVGAAVRIRDTEIRETYIQAVNVVREFVSEQINLHQDSLPNS